MKELILKILREQLEGIGENPLSEKEIRLFKYVNSQRGVLKTQKEIIDLFETLMKLVNKPEQDARFYYEINNNNQWYYVVTSYGWYPIYLYIDEKWYRVSNAYSSSTAKHLSGSNPMRRTVYDENLGEPITMVTSEEIKKIRDGQDMNLIKQNRITSFMDKYGQDFHKQKPKMLTIGWGDDRKKVKYSVEKVEEMDGKIVFTINIEKAGTVEGTNKLVVNPEGYHHPSPFSEDLEKGIKQRIISDYSDYLKKDNTDFEFKHPNS